MLLLFIGAYEVEAPLSTENFLFNALSTGYCGRLMRGGAVFIERRVFWINWQSCRADKRQRHLWEQLLMLFNYESLLKDQFRQPVRGKCFKESKKTKETNQEGSTNQMSSVWTGDNMQQEFDLHATDNRHDGFTPVSSHAETQHFQGSRLYHGLFDHVETVSRGTETHVGNHPRNQSEYTLRHIRTPPVPYICINDDSCVRCIPSSQSTWHG